MRFLGAALVVVLGVGACGERTPDDDKAMCEVFADLGEEGPSPTSRDIVRAYDDLEQLEPGNRRLAAIRATVLEKRNEFAEVGLATEHGQIETLRAVCDDLGVPVSNAQSWDSWSSSSSG